MINKILELFIWAIILPLLVIIIIFEESQILWKKKYKLK